MTITKKPGDSIAEDPTTDVVDAFRGGTSGKVDSALPFVRGEALEVKPSASPPRPRKARTARTPLGSADVVRVATIAAELSREPVTTVLARHGLSARSFAEIERHWMSRLASDLERGETTLRDAYDAAFLEARALHRGDLGQSGVSELVQAIATESSHEDEERWALDLADAMRFQRRSAKGG